MTGIICDCGNVTFYVSVGENRGLYVELICTKCNKIKDYMGEWLPMRNISV